MTDRIRAQAQTLFRSAFAPSDRLLVTGAGGWFGMTIAALAADGPSTMLVTQRPRTLNVHGRPVDAVAWDWDRIREFAPTVVIDCAFILRDHIHSMPLDRYVHENSVLTSRLLQLGHLEGVSRIISVSSGAAVHPVDAASVELAANPYGYLKRQAELAVRQLGEESGVTVVVARPWSVTGGFVTRPERYAFSNLVLQARTGTIEISAQHAVWRRFVGVDDFFAVSLASSQLGSGVIESGGELIEFSPLAQRVLATLGLSGTVRRADPAPNAPVDDYYSSDESWAKACRELEYEPASLDQQILAVDSALS